MVKSSWTIGAGVFGLAVLVLWQTLLVSPFSVQADFPDQTTYRRPILIDYSSGSVNLTAYQIRVTIDTSTLIGASKMRSDCGDIRFNDTDDYTALSYWIESGCNSASTVIWIEVPTLTAAASKTIYLYYGNNNAVSESNGGETFDFFDDFDSFDTNKWSSTNGTSNYSVTNSTLTLTAGTIYTNQTVTTMPGYINEARVRWNSNSAQSGLNIASRLDTQSGNANSARLAYLLKVNNLNQLALLAADGTQAAYNISPTTEIVSDITLGNSYVIGTQIANSVLTAYVNRSLVAGSSSPYDGWSGSYYMWLGYFNGSNAGSTTISETEFDWVLTRKYAATVPSVTVNSEQADRQYSLRLYGNGVDAPDQDRVKIPLNNPERPIDVAHDFTIEFWMRAASADNTSGACVAGAQTSWTNGNIIIDRDIFGNGDYGDYGISLYGGRIAFGASVGSSDRTICSATSVANNQWRHIAVTRNSSSGQMRIFINGVLDATGTGPTGDISYRNNRSTSYPNSDPFFVIGAEKHDYSSEYPSYNGFIDELRVSSSVRYTATFTPPTVEYEADADTVALYHFNEGFGTEVYDVSGASGEPSNGTFSVGGSPSGPEWSTESAPLNSIIQPTPSPTPSPTPTASPSPTPTTTPLPTPNLPTNLTLVGGNSRISARWTAPVGGGAPSDYIVEYRVAGGGGYTVFNDGVSTTTNTMITGLSNETTYEVRVAASNASGNSTYSSVVSATATDQELVGILVTGQSFASGYDGNPALTTTQPYENLRFNYGGTNFVVLREDINNPNDNVDAVVESPMSALANLITARSSGSPQLVLFNNSFPGYTYSQLQQGTSLYNGGITDIATASGLAGSLGRDFRVRAIANLHGPADRLNAASYAGYLNEWQSDYQTDISAETGQSGALPMFIDQSSNFTAYGDATSDLVIAQLTASESNANIYMVGPKYQFDYPPSDGIHLINTGYRWLGEYYGKAIKQVLYDGRTTVSLTPAEVVRNSNVVSIRFNVPEAPIVIDTTRVLAVTNYGFEYDDNGTPPDINGVAIDGQDTVRITLESVPVAAGQTVRYAYTGTPSAKPGAQSAGSARGNLRDSDSTESLYGNDLFNWAVHFSKSVILDETAPMVSNIEVTPGAASATINWSTNEPASSVLAHGPSAGLTQTTSEANTFPRVTTHSKSLSSLPSCARYYYRASSEDLAQNIGQSSASSFFTGGCLGGAAVNESVAESLTTASGGVAKLARSSGRAMVVNAPAGFAAVNAIFQILELNQPSVQNLTGNPTGLAFGGSNVYELKALTSAGLAITSFLEPLTVTITYQDSDIDNLDEASLQIRRWNGSSWQELTACSVDEVLNEVSCTTTQFSTFGLFGQSTASPTPSSTTVPNQQSASGASLNIFASAGRSTACSASLPGSALQIFRTESDETSITLYMGQAVDPYNKVEVSYGRNINADEHAFLFARNSNEGVLSYQIRFLSPGTEYFFKARAVNDCAHFLSWSPTAWKRTNGVARRGVVKIPQDEALRPPNNTPAANISTSPRPTDISTATPAPVAQSKQTAKPIASVIPEVAAPESKSWIATIWDWVMGIFGR